MLFELSILEGTSTTVPFTSLKWWAIMKERVYLYTVLICYDYQHDKLLSYAFIVINAMTWPP